MAKSTPPSLTPAEDRIVAQTIRRALPCQRCGSFDGATTTWAVPLDQGGQRSEWNYKTLCKKCRRWHDRKWREQTAVVRPRGKAQPVSVGDRHFPSFRALGNALGLSATSVRRASTLGTLASLVAARLDPD